MLMGIVNLQTPGAHYYLPQGHSSADQIPKLTDLRLKITHQQSGGELSLNFLSRKLPGVFCLPRLFWKRLIEEQTA